MALTDFIGAMGILEKISLASETLQKEDDIVKKNQARSYLKQQGIEGAREVLAGEGVNFDGLTEEQKSQYIQPGLEFRQMSQTDRIGNSLNGSNLEGLLNEIPNERLEKIALVKELESGKVDGYEELIEKYRGYLSAQELQKKYNEGKLDEKERGFFRKEIAEEIAKDVVKKNKDKYSDATLDVMSNIVKLAASLEDIDIKKYMDEGISSFVKKRKEEFEKYQTDNKRKVVDYVRESIKALRDNNKPEDSMIARSLIYQAAK